MQVLRYNLQQKIYKLQNFAAATSQNKEQMNKSLLGGNGKRQVMGMTGTRFTPLFGCKTFL
jgi:hypothetical protein